jgi:hypothetical protein
VKKLKLKKFTVAVSDSGVKLVFSKEKVKEILRPIENDFLYGSKTNKKATPGILKYA